MHGYIESAQAFVTNSQRIVDIYASAIPKS
jgi:hypothetical protein